MSSYAGQGLCSFEVEHAGWLYRYGIDKRVADWQAFREELLHPVILHYTNKKPGIMTVCIR